MKPVGPSTGPEASDVQQAGQPEFWKLGKIVLGKAQQEIGLKSRLIRAKDVMSFFQATGLDSRAQTSDGALIFSPWAFFLIGSNLESSARGQNKSQDEENDPMKNGIQAQAHAIFSLI